MDGAAGRRLRPTVGDGGQRARSGSRSSDRFVLVVVGLEDGQQLRDGEQVLDLLGEVDAA